MGMNVCEAYLLGALVGDGGLYSEKRGNGSTEYRVVWTSKDRVYLEAEIVPRIIEVMNVLGAKSKIQLRRSSTRYEVRVSSKALYNHFKALRNRLHQLIREGEEVITAFIKGFYDAEGEKSGKRVRMWNKDRKLLQLVEILLMRLGLNNVSLYLDDRRHGVYCLEVRARERERFFTLLNEAVRSPRKFRRA